MTGLAIAAGKTTTVKILSALVPADGGTVRVAGHGLARDPDGVHGAIGVTGHVVGSVVQQLVGMAVIIGVAFAIGLRPDATANAPMPLVLLPFLGSGLVPTDSMPTVLRWSVEYQPFTPIMETVRGLLFGTPIGGSAAVATAWCVGLTAVSYLWAKRTCGRA